MKAWSVAIPITGVLRFTVEGGADEDEAKETAFNAYNYTMTVALNKKTTGDEAGSPGRVVEVYLDSYELHRHVVQGNVFYGSQNEPEVEMIDNDEED